MNLKSKRLEAKVIKFLGNEFQLKNLNTLTSSQIKLKTLIQIKLIKMNFWNVRFKRRPIFNRIISIKNKSTLISFQSKNPYTNVYKGIIKKKLKQKF